MAVRSRGWGRIVLGIGLAWATAGQAQLPSDLALVPVVTSGLVNPTAIASPRDGSGRMFILERSGRIRVLNAAGTLLSTPYYTRDVNTGDVEQGLLGIAFDPSFASNGTLYIVYGGTPAEQRGLILRRLVASDPAANVFSGSQAQVLRVPELSYNHNGGDIHFGTDGYLYWSIGSGGGEPADHAHAQALGDLRGKILRLDVRNPTGSASAGMCGATQGQPAQYSIPAGNPFTGTGQCREVWLYGLRNPWRFSIDRATGDLWIGDVGVNREEIDRYIAGGNRNFGYPRCQASQYYPPTGSNDCPAATGTAPPQFEYPGGQNLRCAVTGGLRYRGSIAGLRGIYVFGDSCSSEILLGTQAGSGSWSYAPFPSGIPVGYGTVAAFGEGENGRLYVVDHQDGRIFRLYSSQENEDVVFISGFE